MGQPQATHRLVMFSSHGVGCARFESARPFIRILLDVVALLYTCIKLNRHALEVARCAYYPHLSVRTSCTRETPMAQKSPTICERGALISATGELFQTCYRRSPDVEGTTLSDESVAEMYKNFTLIYVEAVCAGTSSKALSCIFTHRCKQTQTAVKSTSHSRKVAHVKVSLHIHTGEYALRESKMSLHTRAGGSQACAVEEADEQVLSEMQLRPEEVDGPCIQTRSQLSV
eukprot:1503431-Pleurochrysis_carterae.AAC.1